MFGGLYGKDVAERIMGAKNLRGAVSESIIPGGTSKKLTKAIQDALHHGDVGLAAQRDTPGINKLMNLFSSTYWGNKVTPGASKATTGAAARENIISDVVKRLGKGGGKQRKAVKSIVDMIPGRAAEVVRDARTDLTGEGLKRLPGKWKGALIGAALVSAPFVLYRLLKTRELRSRGGTAAESAAEKAERLLSEAGALSKQRKKLLSQPA
jgi:hypothetical protein